jgi:hypothetical protein
VEPTPLRGPKIVVLKEKAPAADSWGFSVFLVFPARPMLTVGDAGRPHWRRSQRAAQLGGRAWSTTELSHSGRRGALAYQKRQGFRLNMVQWAQSYPLLIRFYRDGTTNV